MPAIAPGVVALDITTANGVERGYQIYSNFSNYFENKVSFGYLKDSSWNNQYKNRYK